MENGLFQSDLVGREQFTDFNSKWKRLLMIRVGNL